MRRPTLLQLLIGQTILMAALVIVIAALVTAGRKENTNPGNQTPKDAAKSMGGDYTRGQRGSSGVSGTEKGAVSGGTSIPVKVAKVVCRNMDATLWDSTWLEAETEVDVLTKATGEIVKLNVEEGDSVKEGDVLAEIESDKQQVECNKAKVNVEDAKVSLRNAEVALAKAKRTLENCKQSYDRAVKMVQQRVISSEDYDSRKLECDKAEAEFDKSELDLEAAKLKVSTEELGLETAKLSLDYTKIRSPITGVVTARGIERGQVVNTNYPAFRVADYDPILARISVPETELSKIRIGGLVRVEAESMPGKELMGKVRLISPTAQTGKVKVEVEIPNPPPLPLRPGMYATMHLVTETHENALVIPKRALIIESDANEVFVAQEIIQVDIPLDRAERFKVDEPVHIIQKTESGENGEQEKTIEGRIANVLPPAEGDVAVEATIALPDGHGLKKDAPARVRLPASGEYEAVEVDVKALDPKIRALRRRVEIGLSERNDVEVTDGANEGERVVTVGNEELKNGSILMVMEEEPASGESVPKVAASTPKQPSGSQGGERSISPEFIEKMKERILANEKVKAEFDERVKTDPSLNTDPKKFFEFVGEMREKGLIERRGRPGTE